MWSYVTSMRVVRSLSPFVQHQCFLNQKYRGGGSILFWMSHPGLRPFKLFPEHREFVTVCREAEAKAKRTGQKTHYWWRGYRGVVAANLPPITVPGLEVRLMNALGKIANKSIPEIMVNISILLFLFSN